MVMKNAATFLNLGFIEKNEYWWKLASSSFQSNVRLILMNMEDRWIGEN